MSGTRLAWVLIHILTVILTLPGCSNIRIWVEQPRSEQVQQTPSVEVEATVEIPSEIPATRIETSGPEISSPTVGLDGREVLDFIDDKRTMAFSPNGTLLALKVCTKKEDDRYSRYQLCSENQIVLWDVTTKEIATILFVGEVDSVAFAPDGQTIVTGAQDMAATAWDVTTGLMRYTLPNRGNVDSYQVAFTPNGQALITGSSNGKMIMWDIESKKWIRSGPMPGLIFFTDGQTFALKDDQGAVKLWDVVTGEVIHTFENQFPLAFSMDWTLLASAGKDNAIILSDVVTEQSVQTLTGHAADVLSAAFSPNGKLLASGGGDHTVRLWDVITGQNIQILTGHTDSVTKVIFSPDGKFLVTEGNDNTVRLWDVTTE